MCCGGGWYADHGFYLWPIELKSKAKEESGNFINSKLEAERIAVHKQTVISIETKCGGVKSLGFHGAVPVV